MNRSKKIATAICGMFAVGAGLMFGRAAILADEFPSPDTELNDLPGDLPLGRYIEYIATDVSTNSVSLSNGVLVVGSEALDLFEMTNLTYEAAVRDAAEGTKEAIGSLSNEMAKVSFSGDYSDLTNKPSINGVVLDGEKRIVGAEIPVDDALGSPDIATALGQKFDKSGGTVTGTLEVVNDSYGFTVKKTSGDYLQIRHGTVAGNFWYVNYSVANVGSGELRLPYDNIIPANVYSLAEVFRESTTYALNSLCTDSQGVLYRCVNPNGHTGAWVDADFTPATVEDVLSSLRKSAVLTEEPITNSVWTFSPAKYNGTPIEMGITENAGVYSLTPMVGGQAAGFPKPYAGETNAVVWKGTSGGGSPEWVGSEDLVATRLPRYVLGDQVDKPLASASYAEALRQGKADRAANPTAGNLAALDADGNPIDSFIAATNVALKTDISPTEPAFSNAVLAVGLGIDTNTVAAINELVDSTHSLPVTGATSVGALLLALAAAIAALKRGKADKPATFTEGDLAALDKWGNPVDAGWTAGDLARYSLTDKTIVNNAVALDDRACNYIDARTLDSSDSLDIDFPALVDGKARDFVLAVECGANPPTISYAAFVTIMAEDASTLTPEEGMNIYSFTEFKTNMFIAARKLVSTVVDNSPESGDQLLLAMQKRGIDTTGITNFGGVETALGLGDTATPQDAIDAVMN